MNNQVGQAEMDAATKAMYGMLMNVAFMIATNYFIKYFNLTDPAYLLYVRIGFAATQALIVSFLLALRQKIQRNAPSSGTVEVMEPTGTAGQPAIKRILTPKEYDLLELSKQVRGVATSVLFSVALHYFFKSSHLLIMGSVNALRTLLTSPLVKLYVWGGKAEGPLARPFREPPSPLADLIKTFMSPEPEAPKKKLDKKDSDDESSDDDRVVEASGRESPVKSDTSDKNEGSVRHRSGKKN